MRPVAILLPLALVLNLAALVLPFVTVTLGMTSEEYSLLHTVNMLWKYGFPGLAVLVGLFSVVFPFAKLLVLAGVHWGGWPRRWAATIGGLGKWSMLDLFLVVLLLAVSYDRLLVSAEPEPGLVVFTLAIVCSMVAGELLHPPAGEPRPDRGRVPYRKRRWGVLLLTAIGTVASLSLPLFVTDAWFMSDVRYSLMGICRHLLQLGAWVPAAAVALFLIVMPVVRLVFLGLLVACGPRWLAAAGLAGRWSMLEPFALALAIFILEGREALPSALDRGGAILLGAMVLSAVSSAFLLHARRGPALPAA